MASKKTNEFEPTDEDMPMNAMGETEEQIDETVIESTVLDGPDPPDAEATGISVYIGPSIFGVITTGTVYPKERNAVIGDMTDAVKRYPLIASLIINIEDLPISRIKVKTPGNLLYANYNKLAGELNQGGNTNA